MKPKKELVRVVRAPVKEDENGVQTGGEVSLDLTGRKPGRGAYVCRDPECLKKAQKARRFERAFSCKIEDAVYRCDRKGGRGAKMNRALSALGLARRAGKLNWGFDTAVEAMRSGACGVVILAADLSDKTKKNVRFEAEKYHVSVLEPAFNMEEISAAIGKKAGVLAVCDRGFAEKLKQLIADGEREEMRI